MSSSSWRRALALVVSWSPAIALATGADEHGAQVDKLFAQWDSTHSPGCSVAVSREGAIVYRRGYGMADFEHDVPNTPSTVFHVASISKQFTAAAIVLLAQEGRISLDDPVRKYIPELADFGEPVTIRHLVHHVSGLRDQWSVLDVAGWRYSQDLITDEDVMSVIARQKKLNFPPGTRDSYSNTGYTLLAQIVKRVSGKSLRAFTQERIFGPLGMSRTHFRDDFREIVPGFAYGYTQEDGVLETSVTNFDTVGATSLVTTAEDLMLWEENFYTGRVGGPAFIRQMLERGTLRDGKRIPYAFGLEHQPYRGLPTVSHSGGDAGYAAHLLRFPEQHLSVAVLCNLNDVGPVKLAGEVAEVYLAERMQPPDGDVKVEDSTESGKGAVPSYAPTARQLESYVGVYVSEEIEIPYRVSLREGRLVLDSLKRHASPLVPVAADAFHSEWLKVKFVRNRRGAVTGFELRSEDEAPYLFYRQR